MAYPLQAIYDANGAHVGFLDGPFVLERGRRVVAGLRGGVVVCFDGHVPGTYAAECFLDSTSRVVALTRRRLPTPRVALGVAMRTAHRAPITLPRNRAWSRLTWRQYMLL